MIGLCLSSCLSLSTARDLPITIDFLRARRAALPLGSAREPSHRADIEVVILSLKSWS